MARSGAAPSWAARKHRKAEATRPTQIRRQRRWVGREQQLVRRQATRVTEHPEQPRPASTPCPESQPALRRAYWPGWARSLKIRMPRYLFIHACLCGYRRRASSDS